ncbi:MAG: imidazoleglycerol-phosphate dehydratase HisB [Kouleothrix sp.]|jgi:imidazoleglycerol-phosphate dehydratase|nr:imidazoleglycerol-phosphate dehydratase HisB [Kouleothrix sp.]
MKEGTVTERTATIERRTGETEVRLTLAIDGSGQAELSTGIGFLDHMLTLFAKHGLFDIAAQAHGDLHVDEHHTAEDVCICLGQALDRALGERRGIVRTAHSYVPMDEALGFVAIDLGGRPYAVFEAEFATPRVGQLGTDLIAHLFESIATHGRLNLHARVLYGRNDHHKVEALFKALGRALDAATRIDARLGGAVPSTKGTL